MKDQFHHRFIAALMAATIFFPFYAAAQGDKSETVRDAGEKPLIVLVAGTKSHGYGAHEFNAGCLLMEKHFARKCLSYRPRCI